MILRMWARSPRDQRRQEVIQNVPLSKDIELRQFPHPRVALRDMVKSQTLRFTKKDES